MQAADRLDDSADPSEWRSVSVERIYVLLLLQSNDHG
jgi:hypothetical protein